MALFDPGSDSSLEDALTQKAENSTNDITNQFAKRRRQLISSSATNGRLRSGVSNYDFGDLSGQEIGALGEVQGSLAEALGKIPSEDYANMREGDRSRQLAELIASLNKPSALQQELGLMTGGAKIAGSFF